MTQREREIFYMGMCCVASTHCGKGCPQIMAAWKALGLQDDNRLLFEEIARDLEAGGYHGPEAAARAKQ